MSDPPREGETARLLRVYLQDHYAGATAGLALAERCRRANEDTNLGELLLGLETEIGEDRQSLVAMMARLGYGPHPVKTALGSAGEFVSRLKSNGRLFTYSPTSRVVELEALAAGILTKRNLWRALRVVAGGYPALDAGELERLADRASSQLDRVHAAHVSAAAQAFTDAGDSATAQAVPVSSAHGRRDES